MIRQLFKGSSVLAAGFLPLDWYDHDKVDKAGKTAQEFWLKNNDNETGSQRLYRMFSME